MKKQILFSILFVSLGVALSAYLQSAYAADAAAGKKVYDASCTACHGPSGVGDGPMAKALKPQPASFAAAGFLAGKTDADLAKVIKEGKGGAMPPFKTLKDDEVANVIAHLRGFAPKK